MNKISLNGEWKLFGNSPLNEEINITGHVPGSTLNDIADSYIGSDLGNIFFRDNAEKYQKYERYSWVFSRCFEIDELTSKIVLHFDKLDTYCDIYINNEQIAKCENGFIPYEFDITNKLIIGTNKIEIHMYSPVLLTERKPKREGAFTQERLYTRRMQCSYGWDWLMRFVSCGIGDAYLISIPNGMKIDEAYIYTKYVDEDCAEIGADIWFKDYADGEIINIDIINEANEIVKSYSQYCEEYFMRVSLNINNPQLWNPNGYGASVIYKMKIKCGKTEKIIPFGIRTIKIVRLTDKKNSDNYKKCLELKESKFASKIDENNEFSGFVLKINNRSIMCKGANWVPCEPFDGKDTKNKITELLELAKEAGVNFLRVWGGGNFDCEHFYDECSRLGILVAQDFLMACGDYPEDESFLEQLRKEAEYATKFLRNKACLVWWCGDNENATRVCATDRNYMGRNAAFKAIGPVVYKNDYYREFFPSSPIGGNKYMCNTVGMTHNTSFMNHMFAIAEEGRMDCFKERYKEFRARFVAEEPTFGAICEPSLRRFMTTDDIYDDNMNMWFYHTKNNPFLKKHLFEYNKDMAEGYLGDFIDGKDRYFKLKYFQYEWVRISLEQARREKGFCNGMIFWMFNDCWPAASGWSLIDYYCIPKASYYSFKRAAKGIIGSIDFDKANEKYVMYVCSDKEPCDIIACGKKMLKNGENLSILFEKSVTTSEQNAVTVFELNEPELSDDEILVLEIKDERGDVDRTFYKNGNLEIKPCDVEVIEKTNKYIEVAAKEYVHIVELEGEMIFDDNYFSLLPGEKRRIHYSKSETDDISICGYSLK